MMAPVGMDRELFFLAPKEHLFGRCGTKTVWEKRKCLVRKEERKRKRW
jgi:hypothetical protein